MDVGCERVEADVSTSNIEKIAKLATKKGMVAVRKHHLLDLRHGCKGDEVDFPIERIVVVHHKIADDVCREPRSEPILLLDGVELHGVEC